MSSAPEHRGYPSKFSDVAALLTFDHQVGAVNLLARLNAAARGTPQDQITARRLVDDLARYLLFDNEAAFPAELEAPADFARRVSAWAPLDRRGRSCAQLDLRDRLMRYSCSYMLYSDAFDALPRAAKDAVYARMLDVLSRWPADRQQPVLEILADTKPDFRDAAATYTLR